MQIKAALPASVPQARTRGAGVFHSMDTDAHTRKPRASRASTRQIATRTHADSRDPEDAHVRKGTTKKDGWGQKVYPRGSFGSRRVEGPECDRGRATR